MQNRIVAVANHFQTSKNTENSMPKSVAMDIEHIWADETVKAAVAKAAPGELVLQDMADFFLSQAVKLSDVNYVPTDQDILNLRVPTTQITETVFKIDGKSYHFFDVAGQQKYRKRWAPYFDTVHNILFLISLAAYDQMLAEDPAVNRMTDAINLFSDICNNELLKKIPVTLFMNKKDLFEKKMATSDIALYFPDYAQIDPAKRDFKRAVRFFEKKFSTAAKSVQANRIFDSHVTCCTDTNVMKTVIHSVIDSIIRTTMRDVGIA
ncbi:guanine nucleotide binding protein, alpha subunit [Entophlyctis helioformis]|nr:guanine nucleotide binding protein, alpha subunit [Entophlyctis helioformis]